MKEIRHNFRILALVLLLGLGLAALQTSPAQAAVKQPSLTAVSHVGTTVQVQWEKVSGISGYQIQYATNRLFLGRSTVKAKKTAAEKTIKGLSLTGTYYVRLRAYKTSDGQTKYSAWSLSENTGKHRAAKLTALKDAKGQFELRAAAKRKVPGYDTLQGSCYAKGYVYFTLYNRDKEKCKIAKVRLKDRKVVQVSAALPLHHGNDMTYNTKKNVIVVAHSGSAPTKVSVIDPKTLTVKSTKSITLPETLPGMTQTNRKNYKGFGAIAYNSKHKQYVVRLLVSRNFLILDQNLQPVKYIPVTVKSSKPAQGIDTYDDYILMGHSFSSDKPYNMFYVFDWKGNYLSYITLNKGMELESIFHTSSAFYISCYTSYYKTELLKDSKLFTRTLQRDGYVYKLSKL